MKVPTGPNALSSWQSTSPPTRRAIPRLDYREPVAQRRGDDRRSRRGPRGRTATLRVSAGGGGGQGSAPGHPDHATRVAGARGRKHRAFRGAREGRSHRDRWRRPLANLASGRRGHRESDCLPRALLGARGPIAGRGARNGPTVNKEPGHTKTEQPGVHVWHCRTLVLPRSCAWQEKSALNVLQRTPRPLPSGLSLVASMRPASGCLSEASRRSSTRSWASRCFRPGS